MARGSSSLPLIAPAAGVKHMGLSAMGEDLDPDAAPFELALDATRPRAVVMIQRVE